MLQGTRSVVYLVAAVAGVTIMSYVAARALTSTSGAPSNPEAGLTDEQRLALHATVVAESAVRLKQDQLEFARSGLDIDALPRLEIQADAPRATADIGTAARAADVVVLAQSEGAYVDESNGRFLISLRVLEAMKGSPESSIEVELLGGPQRLDGDWVLAIAPFELFLAKGETAVLLLAADPAGVLVQRPFEAMLIKDGRVAAGDKSAFRGPLADATLDEVRAALSRGVQ